jgi:hypothetical protein
VFDPTKVISIYNDVPWTNLIRPHLYISVISKNHAQPRLIVLARRTEPGTTIQEGQPMTVVIVSWTSSLGYFVWEQQFGPDVSLEPPALPFQLLLRHRQPGGLARNIAAPLRPAYELRAAWLDNHRHHG